MIRTRVGYAGGSKEYPTYRSLGSHSETIEIDYDPAVIDYQELLDVFWDSHTPTGRSTSTQYASIIFYHNEDQRRLAEESRQQEETRSGRQLATQIVPYTEFWPAEDYHQKYYLRSVRELEQAFEAMYPNAEELRDSTAAARVNGYVGGHGTLEQLDEEIDLLGLSPRAREKLLEIAQRRIGRG